MGVNKKMKQLLVYKFYEPREETRPTLKQLYIRLRNQLQEELMFTKNNKRRWLSLLVEINLISKEISLIEKYELIY